MAICYSFEFTSYRTWSKKLSEIFPKQVWDYVLSKCTIPITLKQFILLVSFVLWHKIQLKYITKIKCENFGTLKSDKCVFWMKII